MKIIITERQYKRILREEFNYKEKIFKLLNSGQDENIEMVKYLSEGQGYDLKELLIEYFQEYGPPYLNIFNNLELSKEEQEYILSKIYGKDNNIKGGIIEIYDDKGNRIYSEDSDGDWWKYEYDENGKQIYYEHSGGYWEKYEYDGNGNIIYSEDSVGDWSKSKYDSNGIRRKYEYDKNGNMIYFERSDGKWKKWGYNDKGNKVYSEDSDGNIWDNR